MGRGVRGLGERRGAEIERRVDYDRRGADFERKREDFDEGFGAYRALYILNWIYRYFTEKYYSRWISWIAGIVQTALYIDFFYYYFISWKNNEKLKLPE
ncbi:hypothetical protein M5K25_021530 [Dendrobium thyrsiflorum]|uniref:Uncharacterized protein n=1 Tax=Dendrobium thyrsiflorum TaxID=117978 RepID=A0ABD0UJK4_DENTH